MPKVRETEDVILSWNVLGTTFDTRNKFLSKHTCKADFDHNFPRFLGNIKLHDTGYFLSKLSTLVLKNNMT